MGCGLGCCHSFLPRRSAWWRSPFGPVVACVLTRGRAASPRGVPIWRSPARLGPARVQHALACARVPACAWSVRAGAAAEVLRGGVA
eukprot:4681739-Alexandrium_andersonii.AAC.1